MQLKDGRRPEIIDALIAFPLTARLLVRVSRGFAAGHRLGSLRRARASLLELEQDGYVKWQALPSASRGEKERLFYITKKAARFQPAVRDLPRSSAVFRGLCRGEAPAHYLAAVEVASELVRAAGELGERVTICKVIRPRHFTVPVTIRLRTPDGPKERRSFIIPDYTFAVAHAGRYELLFIEVQNETGAIVSAAQVERSFRHKLYKYMLLKRRLREFRDVQRLEREVGRIEGFRVLVVSTKPGSLANLMAAAEGKPGLFLFATLADLQSANAFADPVWNIPGRHASRNKHDGGARQKRAAILAPEKP